MSWADNKGRGDKRYCLVEVGWHRDAKIKCKSVLAKWLHLILWETARDEARNVLGAECAEPEWLAGEIGSGVTPAEAKAALEELHPRLIEIMEDGRLWVKGIQRKHRRISTWKDSEPTNTQPIGLSQQQSTAVNSSRDVTGRDVTGRDGTGREVSSAAPTRVSDPQKKSERIDYQRVMDWWNKLAEELGLAKITSIKNRKDLIRNKLVNDDAFADLEVLGAAIRKQPFLRGESNTGWRLTFNNLFTVKQRATDILEDSYKQKEPPKPKNSEWDGVPAD